MKYAHIIYTLDVQFKELIDLVMSEISDICSVLI
jgi:hypothetical protein